MLCPSCSQWEGGEGRSTSKPSSGVTSFASEGNSLRSTRSRWRCLCLFHFRPLLSCHPCRHRLWPCLSPWPFLPLPSMDRSIGMFSEAAASACARQQSKSIVLTCVLLFRMCEFEWQWFCTDGGVSARKTLTLTSSSNAFPNFCSYSLHVTLPAFERLSLVRLHRVAFSPRHASRPLLTSVFFTVTKALPSHNSDRAKHSLLDGGSLQSLPSGVLRSIWDSPVSRIL